MSITPFVRTTRDGKIGGDELLEAYCARVYARAGTYEEASRQLDMGWRRVRDYVQAWRKRTGRDTKD